MGQALKACLFWYRLAPVSLWYFYSEKKNCWYCWIFRVVCIDFVLQNLTKLHINLFLVCWRSSAECEQTDAVHSYHMAFHILFWNVEYFSFRLIVYLVQDYYILIHIFHIEAVPYPFDLHWTTLLCSVIYLCYRITHQTHFWDRFRNCPDRSIHCPKCRSHSLAFYQRCSDPYTLKVFSCLLSRLHSQNADLAWNLLGRNCHQPINIIHILQEGR